MLRVGLKFPVNGVSLNRIKKNGCEKLYLTTRYLETSTKPQKESRLFKDATLASRLSGHRYSTESKSERGRTSTGALATIGVLTIGTLGILTYAKNDKDFRNTLEGWIPGTDKTIAILFQEEDSYFENIIQFFNEQKQKIINLVFGRDSGDKPAPRPAFTPSALELSPPPVEKPKPEIRVSKEPGKIEVVAEKAPPKEDLGSAASDLLDLEKYAGEHATKAIGAFKEAACAAQEFNAYIVKVVESADATAHSSVWEHLKKAQEKKTKAVEEAEKTAQEALRALKQIHKSIDNPDVHASYAQKTIAKKNIDKILSDVDEAKSVFNQELANANISEKYWKNVKAAREKFQEELKILFPNINIYDKKFQVSDDAFDLFVLHMYHKVDFLQKELDRLQTLGEHKLKAAIKSGEDKEKLEEAICLEVVKERRRLEEEYGKKILELRKELDEEMRKQLKLQAQIHADHLRDALATKDRETDRKITRALSEQKEKEATDHKVQLAAVIGRLRGLDEALKNRLEAEKDASEAQLMWGACQALVRAVKTSPPGTSPAEALRPLGPEISAIKRAAPKNDTFVNVTISGIPEEAVKRGVYPEDALRERFLKVERMARKLALVPEEGASLPIYLLSYLQNFLLVKAVSPIPKHELDDQPIDAQSLDTYDVLQRARYWLDRGDLKMTLRYMNLLKGAPRAVSRDWMNEARIHLETKQAIDSLVAYAGANSLIFMGGGDKKKK